MYIDIDQLTKILQLVGRPSAEFLEKINSETVSIVEKWRFSKMLLYKNEVLHCVFQARNYVAQMPNYTKKPFKDVFTGANESGL